MERRYALVLAGGGAKGIYQIGVWKALRELDICYDVVVGSSIGAINGALMAQNDWDSAFELWRTVTLEKILELPPHAGMKDFFVGVIKNFGVSAAPLKQLLERHIDETKIRTSGIRYGLTTFNLSRLRQEELFIEEIPEGELIPYLLAATAFPGIKTQSIHGKRCIDGGIADNIPFQIVRDSGYKNIIVVDISGLGRNKIPDYEGVNLIYIKNSIDFGKFSTLFGVFDFESEFLERFSRLGYLDTLKVFGRCFGIDYFIEEDECALKAREKLQNIGLLEEYRRLMPKNLRYYIKPEIAVADVLAKHFNFERIVLYRFEEISRLIRSKFNENPSLKNKIGNLFEKLIV